MSHDTGNCRRTSHRRPREPSRKNQTSRCRTQVNAPVLMVPIFKLSPESCTPIVHQQTSFPADYQLGALLELKAVSVPGLASLLQNYPPGLRPGLHEPTGLIRLSKSVKFPSSPLGDTAGQRPDQPHQRRPSPKKLSGTYNRQQAGQTLALYLT